ncbi:MAG: ABC transporter ATP-binding protein [Rhodospirillales bacterium]
MSAHQNIISVESLSHAYPGLGKSGSVPALSDINVSIEPGDILSIVGPSGCGKSTLLKCILGLLEPSGGSVRLDGKSPEDVAREHRIGFVPQKPVFFEWMNIRDNVTLPLRIAEVEEDQETIELFFRLVSLEGFENAHPHELSGGMLGRASLIRGMVNQPNFLFLDEPFNNLDEVLRHYLSTRVFLSAREMKQTVAMVTHDVREAITYSDKVLVLSSRPATVVELIDVSLGDDLDKRRENTTRIEELYHEIIGYMRKSHELDQAE